MAVFTRISRDQLEGFLAAYSLGRVIACTPITEGAENTNYSLETSHGRYVLTIFERRTPPEALPYVVAYMRHLAAAGQPVPEPVSDSQGDALKELAGKPALIVTFLPGESLADPGPVHCAAAGEAVARLHEAAGDFREHRDNPYGIAAWPGLAVACQRRADEEARQLLIPLQEAIDRLTRDWPRELPQGACHTDLFPDNVFFAEGRVSGLIDFYFACSELFAYDLAVCITSWAFDSANAFVAERARAMLAGYEAVRPLQAAERAALPLLCLGAAVRFSLTRLYDRLHPQPEAMVRPKDPGEFAGRVALFQRKLTAGERLA